FGAQVDGYCADITRTVVAGARASERQRALYGVVYEAQRRARAGVHAGMSGRDADALARDPIAARGLGEAFGHSLGHGLGLEVHEAPRLSKTNAEPLPGGAVVTVEPGVYLAGEGGGRAPGRGRGGGRGRRARGGPPRRRPSGRPRPRGGEGGPGEPSPLRPRPSWRSSRPWWGRFTRPRNRGPSPTSRRAAAWRRARWCASSKR